MRWLQLWFVFSLCSIRPEAAGAAESVLARYHFAGSAKLGSDTNASKLQTLASLPETKTLRFELVQKIARSAAALISEHAGTSMETVPLLSTLLNDFLAAESHGQITAAGKSYEFAVGIHLAPDRIPFWETNLIKIFTASRSAMLTPLAGSEKGWEATFAASPASVRFQRAGKFLIVRWSDRTLGAENGLVTRMQKQDRSLAFTGNEWLDADLDWPRLEKWLPVDRFVKPARLRVGLSSRAGDVRTSVKATYAEPIGWKFVPWAMPTNLIREPLVGFTAAQSLSSFVNPPPQLLQAGLNPFTNQIFSWSLSSAPFQSFILLQRAEAERELKKLSITLPSTFNPILARGKTGELQWDTNHSALVWRGLPLIVPSLRVERDGRSRFLSMSLFPAITSSNSPPAELIAQVVTRTNLVYYDWEITQARIGHWRVMSKMPFLNLSAGATNMVTAMSPDGKLALAVEKWLSAVTPLLGNAITEATVSGPRELSMVRRSHLGLTGFEMVALGSWISSPSPLKAGYRPRSSAPPAPPRR